MTNPKRQFIDGLYGQLHLRIAEPETATKPPLLCLHMFPQSGKNFERFLVHASDERVVIAADFPGYGESDPPDEPIAAADYARAIWHMVDNLEQTRGHDKIDLFGIHAGAKLAVEFAHQRPDDVNRIILASAAVLKPDEVAALKKSFTPIPLDNEGTRFQKIWRMIADNRGPGMTDELMATSFAEILRGGENYEWGHFAVFDYNQYFPERVSELPHAIALLNPKDDLYEFTPRTMEYLQNGTLLDCPDWGHGFLHVYAEDLAEKVNAHLSGAAIQ